jgi:hypothetical protein
VYPELRDHSLPAAFVFALALLPSPSAVSAEKRAPAASARGRCSEVVRDAELAREGACARLRNPGCLRVLADFTDGEGRALRDRLAVFGMSADEYLATLPLLDRSTHSLCQAGRSQLLATTGVPRIFVCRPFSDTVRRCRVMAEVYLIHEMLHTLGLGENPPPSGEITRQVVRRCAP